MGILSLAYIIDLGWLRIGPPYIYLNIDPVILRLGPLAIRWYGLMYVVGIFVGLWVIRGYNKRKGITEDLVYRVLWWCIVAGLIGGRLYFVIQQEHLLENYILQPWRILATWEGGMAFYGAIFLIIPTLLWRARAERVNPLVLIDAGVLFAAAGQLFGRIGNIINGDIIGYPSTLPWSTVYQNPNSWACLNPATCNVPVQPAAAYELLLNLILLAGLFYLARRVRRPGILMLVYLYSYAITQFLVFFTRDNVRVSFFGFFANWGLKQAQWTSLVVFILLIPITFLVLRWRYSRPIPEGEVAATYGVPQKAPAKQAEEQPTPEDEEVQPEEATPTPVEAQAVENTPPATPIVAQEEEKAEHIPPATPIVTPAEETTVQEDTTEPVDTQNDAIEASAPTLTATQADVVEDDKPEQADTQQVDSEETEKVSVEAARDKSEAIEQKQDEVSQATSES